MPKNKSINQSLATKKDSGTFEIATIEAANTSYFLIWMTWALPVFALKSNPRMPRSTFSNHQSLYREEVSKAGDSILALVEQSAHISREKKTKKLRKVRWLSRVPQPRSTKAIL